MNPKHHPATNATESRGHFVGRYRVLAELGQGGTANVSLAVAEGPGDFSKLVVLKRMKPQLASEPGFREMFMNEARLAARLNHPNIVQTNEVFSDGALPVIVMQYLEGQTLAELIARADGTLSLAKHLAIISEALTGLQYSHDLVDYDGRPLNVVHRDVTPHNLFITFDGQVKILDFGIAKLSGSNVETETGVIKGKLRYIPPEQIMGEPVDRRADIYSVGVMLWEAAVGKKMWKGLSDATIMNHVVNGELPAPKSMNPNVPDALDALIMKALAPDPEARYPTASALQTALDDFRADLAEQVHPKNIGATLSTLFADVRERTRSLIERQLTSPEVASDGEPIDLRESVRAGSSSYAVSSGNAETLAQGSQKRWWLGVTAAAAVLASLLMWKPEPPTPADAQNSAGNAPITENPPEAPTQAKRTRISITVFPAMAVLTLDGKPLDSNPFTLQRETSDEILLLKAKAEGYKPKEQAISLAKDANVVLKLERLPEPPATNLTKKPLLQHKRPAPSAHKLNCSPPFIIDDRGIKRYKPECM